MKGKWLKSVVGMLLAVALLAGVLPTTAYAIHICFWHEIYKSNGDGTHDVFCDECDNYLYTEGCYAGEDAISNGDGTHDYCCEYCNDAYDNEACYDDDGDEYCDFCGGDFHDCYWHGETYESNGDGTHNAYCDSCGGYLYSEGCCGSSDAIGNGDGTHSYYCDFCGGVAENEECSEYGDNVCEVCGDDCHECFWHDEIYKSNGDGTHNALCDGCGGYLYSEDCCDSGEAISNGDGTHSYYCEYCDGIVVNEACWENGDNVCEVCGDDCHECDCHGETYKSNGDGTHDVFCEDCGEYRYREVCYATGGSTGNDDGTHGYFCDFCGYYGLEILNQPQSVTGENGETVSVKVTAVGAELTYQWYFRNAGSSRWNVSAITTDTYSVKLNKYRAGREVYCVVTDAYGNEMRSESATIGSVPVIVTQPQSVVARKGELAVVTVEAQGEGLTYQWYFRNCGKERWNTSSETSATYKVNMNAIRADRECYCVITDRFGNEVQSEIVKLGVAELAIVSQPQSSDAKKGETAVVTVEAEGEGLTYRWYFRNFGKTRWNTSIVRTNTYTVSMSAVRAGREVYCVITDAYGRTVTSDVATIGAGLEITSQPQSVSGKRGETVTVTVEAEGEGLRYRWYLRNEGSGRFDLSSVTTNTYSAVMNSCRANRELYCVVTDAYGRTVKSEVVVLLMEK